MKTDNKTEAYQIMSRNHFSYEKRREWTIWGARHRECPECRAEPTYRCMNLADITKVNKGQLAEGFVRFNKMPHEKRIDWARIIQGLYQRGYR